MLSTLKFYNKLDIPAFSFNQITIVFSLLLILQFPSLPFFLKYMHSDLNYIISTFFILSAGFYYAMISYIKKIRYNTSFLHSPLLTAFLAIFLLFLNAILYHHQLMLQSIGKGTDAGDALTFTAANLLHGHFPYSRLTYLNNPASAGPGLFIFAMPFTYIGAYGLLIPALVITLSLVVQKITKQTYLANLFLILFLTSPAFIQFMAEGNDYLIIGLVYTLLTIALFFCWNSSRFFNVFFIFMIGLMATSRLNFIYLPAVLSVFLWKRDRKSALYFGITASLIALGIHIGFYLWNPAHYGPLHVVNDYARYTYQSSDRLLLLLFFSAAVAFITLLSAQKTLSSWLFFLWLCLTTPLLIGGFFCVIHQHWDLQGIGLGYITLTAPIFLTGLLCHAYFFE